MKPRFRFYLLPTVLLATFLVVITLMTVTIAVARFETVSEESARSVFSLIAQRNVDQLSEVVVGDASRWVGSQAGLPIRSSDLHDATRVGVLTAAMVTALRIHPFSYSYYVGFDTQEFLQVIGVGTDTRLRQSLGAPEGTVHAVRLTLASAAQPNERTEAWQFLAADGALLGAVSQPAVYAPRSRPWYGTAQAEAGLQMTDPYVYESSQALGLTLSQALAQGGGVVGADITLSGLASFAASSLAGRAGGIAVTDRTGRVLAAQTAGGLISTPPVREGGLGTQADPLLSTAAAFYTDTGSRIVAVEGAKYAYATRAVQVTPHNALHVVAFAPMSPYVGLIRRARDDILLSSLVLLCIFLPLAYVASRRVADTLGALTAESERIQQLDFTEGPPVHSLFYELDLLGQAQHTMKRTLSERDQQLQAAHGRLERLVDSGVQLPACQSQDEVVQHSLASALDLAGAQGGQFWLASGPGALQLAAEQGVWSEPDDISAEDLVNRVHGQRVGADCLTRRAGVDMHVVAVPVLAREDRCLGVLVLQVLPGAEPKAEAEQAVPDDTLVRYAQTLASQAGIALENQSLLRSQRELMESLIQLVASAIDAKSAYTGGHCARVPELARMLAQEACRIESGPLADFRFETEDEWREFRIGTWLHDCGKVTTPEHVVDKATKLETIYNRIHEIRTRFEVLRRDAQIDMLRQRLAGVDEAAAQARFDARCQQLQDDFAFVAVCNIGTESMAPGYRDRLLEIGRQTWLRYFDDGLGLSHGEEARLAQTPRAPLPAVEPLLADKPHHVIPRTDHERHDPRYGFNMEVPEHLYHFGELHNLLIEYGTLTAEERYKVNDHIVQTIVLLDQLPLPANLHRVPEYAGTHHETLIGTGYPRGLSGDQLSVPARIMVIADVFEALTASDRPYKKAKPLSEALRILAKLKAKKHIDADLVDLFLTSGVYLEYARRFLSPDQIDTVDIEPYLG
ncbi:MULTISPECIES: HD domain-containing phosphohydrolase [unclassified Acidovorax]|uniref:HD domain-containing phosphohydrolase n=1 Tax=unclassified Acidovorax TaxID=2684926 RepID=UPI002882D785|nr:MULTISPECIES: HD domain-containing phosphohydrolase [unclassified Acidovorax]